VVRRLGDRPALFLIVPHLLRVCDHHCCKKSSGFSRGALIYQGVTRHHQHRWWQACIGRVSGNMDPLPWNIRYVFKYFFPLIATLKSTVSSWPPGCSLVRRHCMHCFDHDSCIMSTSVRLVCDCRKIEHLCNHGSSLFSSPPCLVKLYSD
jgi:hypothetical protein